MDCLEGRGGGRLAEYKSGLVCATQSLGITAATSTRHSRLNYCKYVDCLYTIIFIPEEKSKKLKKRRRYFSNLYRVRHLRSSKFGIFHLLSILWRRLPASKYSHVCPHGKFCNLSFHLRITIEDDIATPLQCTVDTNRLSRAILSMRSAACDSLSIETNFAICTWCPGNAAQQFLFEYSLSGPLC